jgi:hypothetical protein
MKNTADHKSNVSPEAAQQSENLLDIILGSDSGDLLFSEEAIGYLLGDWLRDIFELGHPLRHADESLNHLRQKHLLLERLAKDNEERISLEIVRAPE